jgi:ATP-binding cassette subfamily C (CFTR/MRP) protein 2
MGFFAAFAALSLSYGMSLNTMLAAFVFFSCMIENKMVAVERIGQYIRLPSEAPLVIEGKVPDKEWPERGQISINNLMVTTTFTFPLLCFYIFALINAPPILALDFQILPL